MTEAILELGCEEVVYSPDMPPLRKEDKEWISSEISAAVSKLEAALTPSGWRKALAIGREWSVIGVVVTTLLSLVALAGSGWASAFNRAANEARFEERTDLKLKKIEQDLDKLMLLGAADHPAEAASKEAAQRILENAEREEVASIPVEIVRQAGRRFTEEGTLDQAAWNVGLGFLRYRSRYVAFQLPPSSTPLNESDPGLAPVHLPPPDKSLQGGDYYFKFNFYGPARPAGEGGEIRSLREPQSDKNTPTWITVSVASKNTFPMILDGYKFRNVVFRNLEVVYRGGPAQLENVVFVNCTFRMEKSHRAEELAKAIFESTEVSVKL